MKKILVANRGEIALRIMKTAKKMGITCCAIYSDSDSYAPYVLFADEAFHLPGNSSADTYLNQDAIIRICLDNEVDAVHPGYGFLSENYHFAEKLKSVGISFIGPDKHALKVMGDKLLAKEAVKKYGIPLMPGTDGEVDNYEQAVEACEKIGFPVLIKASAGGGGKGMRVVEKMSDLKGELARAVSEAESSFSNGSVFVEKFITSPRHIEFQILADKHGNIVHLFERECSIQRRHQKVIEEAPSSILDESLREKMGKAAIDVARACDYVGAGTIEFLLDENKNFYFMEMNTRLQVEHPVTELISGVDLVREQILVEKGEKLSFSQEDLKINGHAIELRVYAENTEENFMPDTGVLRIYREPKGENIRVDSGFVEGMSIPVYYDSMISKLITFGQNRQQAMDKMIEACDNYVVYGVKTTIGFGSFVMKNKLFRKGDFDTNFISENFSAEKLFESYTEEEKMGVIFAGHLLKNKREKIVKTQKHQYSNWKLNRVK
jgi:propionyl-CoA carboxylase alpha chain